MTRSLEEINTDMDAVCTPRDGLQADLEQIIRAALRCTPTHDAWVSVMRRVLNPQCSMNLAGILLKLAITMAEGLEHEGDPLGAAMASISTEIYNINRGIAALAEEHQEVERVTH